MKILLAENRNLSLWAMILKDKFGAEVSKALDVSRAIDFLQENQDQYDLFLIFEPELLGLSEDKKQQLRQEFGPVAFYWYGGIALIRMMLAENPNLASKIIFVSYDIYFDQKQERLQKEMPLVAMFRSDEDFFEEIKRRLIK